MRNGASWWLGNTAGATQHMLERASRCEPVGAKVPEVLALFWVIKVLTTGTGEAASDYLVSVNRVVAGCVALTGFGLALWLQLRTRRYVAGVYWLAVTMVAVFGTVVADVVHLAGVPYPLSTSFYAVVTGAVLVCWRRSEGTLSIHSITTRRRELFYWLTVLATFALGTAAGDAAAFSLHLGFLPAALAFALAITVPYLAWRYAGLNEVAAFWFAYVLTRPLGASVADWLGKPPARSGLGLGDGPVTLAGAVAIGVLVAYLSVARTDIQPGPGQADGDRSITGRVRIRCLPSRPTR